MGLTSRAAYKRPPKVSPLLSVLACALHVPRRQFASGACVMNSRLSVCALIQGQDHCRLCDGKNRCCSSIGDLFWIPHFVQHGSKSELLPEDLSLPAGAQLNLVGFWVWPISPQIGPGACRIQPDASPRTGADSIRSYTSPSLRTRSDFFAAEKMCSINSSLAGIFRFSSQ